MAKLPRDAVAAPNFPLFVVFFAGWITVATLWIATQISDHKGWEPRAYYPPITAALVVLMARWAGSSVGFWMFLRRALAAHALAPIVPVLLFVHARSSDPGATGHGGVFLMIIIGIPYAVVGSLVLGLLGALSSYGVMRAMRGSAAR